MKVISSRNGGPYAYQSRLGWCVAGPIASSKNLKLSTTCGLVAVKRSDQPSLASHYFNIKSEFKDDWMKQLMLSIYHHDFCELPSNRNKSYSQLSKAFSELERKFLDKMESEVERVDGHYQIPLPFSNENVILQNNRKQAVQRSMHLKRKLERNKIMHTHYVDFMTNLIDKGFAVEVDDSNKEETPGHIWYLPHHGVYHPKKPNKLRVVFDCSATYHGESLNESLLQGPDLTNQLTGVLTRFRQEKIAIIGDIEAMFYQVKVPVKHQNFLGYLWWPNGNLSLPLKEFRMTVHLFGGKSSPGCSNYALRKTATDFESEYGSNAAETLKKNFYVDDILKSCPDVIATLKLLANVVSMCAAGGLRLTKLFSN